MKRADSYHKACRKLNNFSSTSAIVTALISPTITDLTLTCDRWPAKQVLHGLATELADISYRHVIQNAGTKTLIPWLGATGPISLPLSHSNPRPIDPHLSLLNKTFVQSHPIMEVDGHILVDFKLFGELADQVNELDQCTPPRIEHTTRQDVLAHVEYSLKSNMKDDTLTPSINDLGVKRALEESKMLKTRERFRSLMLHGRHHGGNESNNYVNASPTYLTTDFYLSQSCETHGRDTEYRSHLSSRCLYHHHYLDHYTFLTRACRLLWFCNCLFVLLGKSL